MATAVKLKLLNTKKTPSKAAQSSTFHKHGYRRSFHYTVTEFCQNKGLREGTHWRVSQWKEAAGAESRLAKKQRSARLKLKNSLHYTRFVKILTTKAVFAFKSHRIDLSALTIVLFYKAKAAVMITIDVFPPEGKQKSTRTFPWTSEFLLL